jgi:hypothetical protein
LNWDDIERELNNVFDALVTAGYVEEWGHSPTGFLWAISDAGHTGWRRSVGGKRIKLTHRRRRSIMHGR